MSSGTKLGVLLDSTHLLSILGIEVEGLEDMLKVLSKLSRRTDVEFYYTHFNLLA